MPNSSKQGKHIIKDWFAKQKDIEIIVDIGPGQATYPKLLGSKYKYVGVEIFEPYIDMFNLYDHYDRLIVGDASQLQVLPKGDCIIFGDVLEHMLKEDAEFLLDRSLKKYRHVVISIPVGESTWGKPHYSNEFEKHISVWEFDEISTAADWDVAEVERGMGIFCI